MLITEKLPRSEQMRVLLQRTIADNKYCLYKPYAKQLKPIIIASQEEQFDVDGTKKPNAVLAGAGFSQVHMEPSPG